MKNENIGADELYLAPEETENLEVITLSDDNESKSPEEPSSDNTSRKSKKPERLEEIIEKRGNNLKVFRMNDGTEQAVFSSSPIHVFDDESRTFEKIENTFTEDNDGRHFIGGKNNFIAKFSREDNNDDIFSIEKGMHKVTVCARKNKKNKNKGVKPILRRIYNEDADVSDILTFSEIEANTDYEYSTESDGVKENIIVKKKSEIYRYPFLLKCENVSVNFDEKENRITFLSNENGEEVFFIPAPFMTDANGVTSTNVYYDYRDLGNGTVAMAIIADREFINSEDRAFPVVIDPQIKLSGAAGMTTYSWENGLMTSNSLHTVGTTGSGDGSCNCKRMYIKLNIPTLPNNPRIKKAELVFRQRTNSTTNSGCKIGLYRVTENFNIGSYSPSNDSNLIDYASILTETNLGLKYTFDITSLVDQAVNNEISKHNLVMKMLDENCKYQNTVTFYGSTNSINKPELMITYESSYGVNTSYRTHTHELGRFGQGSVDLQCGNLMFESEDFAWSGNRMPVTIKHLFNSALAGKQYTNNSAIKLMCADFSEMTVGHGFKLNIMQSMIRSPSNDTYIYIGENGEETYFKKSAKTVKCESNTQCYNLYEDENSGDMLYDPVKLTLKQGEDTYLFNEVGRLIKITDASGNHIDIIYYNNRIKHVIDGAGREFTFDYPSCSDNRLTSITAPDGTSIFYEYTDELLTKIEYPDNRIAEISYDIYKQPKYVTLSIKKENDTSTELDDELSTVYKVHYSFKNNRVESVTEYGANGSVGAQSHYSYSIASARTIVTTIEQNDGGGTENDEIKTVYTFDNDGNVISSYAYTEETGNLKVEDNTQGIHPYSGDGGMNYIGTSRNFICKFTSHSEATWEYIGDRGNVSSYQSRSDAKFGDTVFVFNCSQNDTCCESGMMQKIRNLPKGEYTFSAYVKIESAFTGCEKSGVFLRVIDESENILSESEIINENDNTYIRLITSFTLTEETSVIVQMISNGAGRACVEAPQLEDNPFASAYNHIEGGDFEYNGTIWNTYENEIVSSESFNRRNSLKITGNPNKTSCALKSLVDIKTSASTRETYTISGWAKAYALPSRENDAQSPTFRLRAVIHYTKNFTDKAENSHLPKTTEAFADFNPRTDEWQYVSFQIAKEIKAPILNIQVYCDYDYNIGDAYFDDIQAVRSSIETNLTDEDFAVTTTPETTVDEDAEEAITEATNEIPEFAEVKDDYGNTLTETTFTDGEFGTIYRSFKFNEDNEYIEGNDIGNNLIEETDARGNTTKYTVDSYTSRNDEVIDRLGNKTAYEYDDSGRTTKVTSAKPQYDENGNKKTDENDNILYDDIATVSYSYDTFDNMTEIIRGDGMKYALAYNEFHNLESIGIEGKAEKLIQYTYKNGNGRLKQMTYANGHTMNAVYNSIGQMIAEKWFESKDDANKNDSTVNPTAYYKYSYDGNGNIIRSIDISGEKEYNYEYEDGKIVRATESDIELNANEIVISKTLLNSVRYYYNNEGQMTKKVITFANNSTHTVYFENKDDNNVVRFEVPDLVNENKKRIITSHSKTDSFGRKVFDELQLGTAFVARQFSYTEGDMSQTHIKHEKGKSSPTTQLVSRIVLTGGRTLDYEYDAEERITKVTDSVDGITEYTYDALGQLLTETKDDKAVNTMTYDNYGNIKSKNGVEYHYHGEDYSDDESTWKDLLIQIGNDDTDENSKIIYDEQGNPTSYLGHTLTWEKGRQLKSYDNNTYTYNANGIRTSKTIRANENDEGVTHYYTLDGTKILRETWGSNTLVPLYDNEDNVCGIIYNGVPYYFLKNLQGDVIAILDKDAKTVAEYSYDAWGVSEIKFDSSACQIATINPFRYRSYYFDKEIGLYYLQSRYYDAGVGRFINADATPQMSFVASDAITSNMYSYCSNSPSNMCDESGFYGITFKIMSSIVSAFSGAYIGAAIATYFGLKGWKKVLCMVGGAALMGFVEWLFPLANLYAAVKRILYAAGCAYLSIKGYSIAAMAYSHGMWGAGYSLSSNKKQKFIDKIKSCQEYKDMKSKLVKRYEKGEKSPKDTIEFVQDIDLYYAIQHMSITLTYNSKKEKYKITMYDRYNFDSWRKIFSKTGISFANAANNLGLLMQKCGMMIPYDISLQFYD